MRDQARVVVIGGGIVGCSVLYHLAKLGWSDVMLVEKTELTAGSTWHAAGLLPLFNMSYSVGQLHKYSHRPLSAAGGGNRAGGELPPHRQPQARHQPGADGRVPQLLRHREHHRRPLRADRPQRDRRPLAALQPGGAGRRPLPPPRWPCRAGGRDPGIGEGSTRQGRGDQPQHRGHRHRADPCGRVAGEDYAGRHHLRDGGDGHRLLGPAGGCHGGPGSADDPG